MLVKLQPKIIINCNTTVVAEVEGVVGAEVEEVVANLSHRAHYAIHKDTPSMNVNIRPHNRKGKD